MDVFDFGRVSFCSLMLTCMCVWVAVCRCVCAQRGGRGRRQERQTPCRLHPCPRIAMVTVSLSHTNTLTCTHYWFWTYFSLWTLEPAAEWVFDHFYCFCFQLTTSLPQWCCHDNRERRCRYLIVQFVVKYVNTVNVSFGHSSPLDSACTGTLTFPQCICPYLSVSEVTEEVQYGSCCWWHMIWFYWSFLWLLKLWLCVCQGVWCGPEMTGSSSLIPQSTSLSGRDLENWLDKTLATSLMTHHTKEKRQRLMVCDLPPWCNQKEHVSQPWVTVSLWTDSSSSCQSSGLHGDEDDQEHSSKRNKWVYITNQTEESRFSIYIYI